MPPGLGRCPAQETLSRAVRRGGKGFEKPGPEGGKGFEKLQSRGGKGFEKLVRKGSLGFENRQCDDLPQRWHNTDGVLHRAVRAAETQPLETVPEAPAEIVCHDA